MAFNSLQSLDVPWTLVSSVIAHQVLQATQTFIILCALLQTCQTHCCHVDCASPLPSALLERLFHFLVSLTTLLVN